MTLCEQMSLRLTEAQRDYLRAEAQRLRDDPATAAFRWSEADVVRAFIEDARRQGYRVAAATSSEVQA